ncbi:MAG: Calx-beta domain-containing protein [Saccharospirillum sp.]
MTVQVIGKGLILLMFSLSLLACDSSSGDSGAPSNPLVLLSDTAIAEGDSGLAPILFELQSPVAQSVAYRTFNISAAANSDYVPVSGNLTVASNEIITIEVQVIGDARVEATEIFGLEIRYEDGTVSRFEGTIINDDFPQLSVDDRSIAEGNQGTRSLEFTLALDEATVDAYPVRVVTRNQAPGTGIAAAGIDFEPIDRILDIPAGEDSLPVSVSIIGDIDIEPDETFILEVFNQEGDLLDSAVGEIRNDDIPGEDDIPAASVADVTLAEGDSGDITAFEFTVTLSFAANFVYRVQYETLIDTLDSATLGEDLLLQSGQLEFAPGETQQSFIIEVQGDDDFEADETFTVLLNTSEGFEFDRATGTILNDDNPIVTVSDVSEYEGNEGDTTVFQFDVSLDQPLPQAVALKFETRAVTATSGNDFEPLTNESVTFTPDKQNAQINVTVIGDNAYEPDETFQLQVSRAGTVLATGTGTIVNDDLAELAVGVSGGSQRPEGGPGETRDVQINVILLQQALNQLDYYFRTFDGSATGDTSPGAGIDYEQSQGQVRFLQNTTTPLEPVVVRLYGDALFEADETFYVRFFTNEQDALANQNAIDNSEVEIIIQNDDFLEVSLSPTTQNTPEGQPDPGDEVTERSLASLIGTGALPVIEVSGAIIETEVDIHLDILDALNTNANDLSLDPAQTTLTVPAGDYFAAPLEIPFEAIRIYSDRRLENDETVRIGITPNTFDAEVLIAGSQTDFAFTLINDDHLQVRFDDTGPLQDNENNPVNAPRIQAINEVASNYTPGGPGGGPLTLTISLDAASTASSDDFAAMPVNEDLYDLSPGGIAANQTFSLIEVFDDNLIEAPEMAVLNLTSTSSLVEVEAGFDTASYEVISDDQITVSFSETQYSVTEGVPPAAANRVSLCLDGGIVDAGSPLLPLSFTNADTSADEGDDYDLDLDAVVIPEGNYSVQDCTVIRLDATQIIIADDGIVEADESFSLALDPPAVATSDYLTLGTPDTTTVTIISNGTLEVAFVLGNYEGLEGVNGNPPEVRVTGTTETDVSIPITVGDLNAEGYPAEPADFDLDTLVIPSGHSGTVDYDIELSFNNNNEAQFNRILPLALNPSVSDPLVLGAQTETRYRILDDDQERMIHGTGSDQCANDADGDIACGAVTAPYDRQDALLGQTALAVSNRREAVLDGDDWVCVDDDLTGLTWAFEKANPQDRNYNAGADAATALLSASTGLCSRQEWRLPTVAELYNLMDFSSDNQLLDDSIFDSVGLTSADYYWSGTTDASANRLRFTFFDGDTRTTGNQNKVLLVSASAARQLQEQEGQAAYVCASDDETLPPEAMTDHRFTLSGSTNEETVTDNLTGLTWSVRSLDSDDSAADPIDINWGSILAMAGAADYAGLDDWRVPTIKELLSLQYFGCNTLGGTRPDLGLTPHFVPLMDAGQPLPLVSSTVVDNGVDDSLAIWTLAPELANLVSSDLPSNLTRMQLFLVRD